MALHQALFPPPRTASWTLVCRAKETVKVGMRLAHNKMAHQQEPERGGVSREDGRAEHKEKGNRGKGEQVKRKGIDSQTVEEVWGDSGGGAGWKDGDVERMRV